MVYATPLMTPTMALGLSIHLSMFELRETSDWDIFLALGKRRGFSPGAAACHSQYARVYSEFLLALSFFHCFRHQPTPSAGVGLQSRISMTSAG